MLSILHADGDRELRETHAEFLAAQGYEVHMAAGGVECVEKLRHFSPRLLILDDALPWGGGTGVLGVMREEPRLRQIPVVVTSADSSVDGVTDFLGKPFTAARLLEKIRAVLKGESDFIGDDISRLEDVAVCLEREIRARTWGRVMDLCVECVRGFVIIHGKVRTYHAKQLVLVAAMNYVAGRGIEVAFDVEVS